MPNLDSYEIGTAGDDAFWGADGNDTFYGNLGNDTFQPGLGNDLVVGDAGDDVFFFSGGNDTVDGGLGSDLLCYEGTTRLKLDMTSLSPQMIGINTLKISNVEHVEYYGTNGNFIIGSSQPNSIRSIGSETNDFLFGLGGDDSINGGDGSDTILGGNGNDVLMKTGGFGRMFGGSGEDTLSSEEGGIYVGGDEADILFASAAKDVLWGGNAGTKTGDGAVDHFVFSAAEMGIGAYRDVIRDFEVGTDSIMIITPSGNATFVGQASFTASANEVRAIVIGKNTLVQIDLDGDGVSDGDILLNGQMTLSSSDFIF